MENIHKLEQTVAQWYKNVPHLPKNGQKWLANNVWWIVLIGVILSVISTIGILSATLFAGALLTGFGGIVGAAVGGIALAVVLISLVFTLADVIIGAMAISPLKAMQARGWKLLFIIMLINVASLVLTFLFNFNLFSLIWGLIFVGIGGYFLFEIRPLFESSHAAKKS